MNNEAVVAITFGFSAFNNKRIGLKKIPPPIPTTPDTKPKIAPIAKAKKKFSFFIIIFLSSKDLLLMSNKIPAIERTQNNKISKISFWITNEPPINANGIDPNKKGTNNLKLKFPARIQLNEFPETTITLQKRAIKGKI